jgi:hypothetical protein
MSLVGALRAPIGIIAIAGFEPEPRTFISFSRFRVKRSFAAAPQMPVTR